MILKQLKAFFTACLFILCIFTVMIIFALLLPFLNRNAYTCITIGLIVAAVASFRYGFFKIAVYYFHIKKFKHCKFFLGLVLIPKILPRSYKSYYFLYKGFIAESDGDLVKAENYCHKALEFGLKTTSDTSLANCFLAEITIDKGNIEEAESYLKIAKELPHKEEIDILLSKLYARF